MPPGADRGARRERRGELLVHINAVHLDTDGNLLISSRFTWTIYKVNLRTGAMMWQLGGKHSTFAIKAAPGQKLDRAGEIFAFQHDPEALGGNVYTVFDDESDGQSTLYSSSRAVTISLDLATDTATLIKSVNQPEGLTTGATGSAQTTKNGDLFVSWGGLSYVAEFSPSGKLLFNAKLPDGVGTYRAYRLPKKKKKKKKKNGIRVASVPPARLQIDLMPRQAAVSKAIEQLAAGKRPPVLVDVNG